MLIIYSLDIEAGEFSDSEILVMLGENGTGKTTFIRMLAGKLAPDSETGKKALLNFLICFSFGQGTRNLKSSLTLF